MSVSLLQEKELWTFLILPKETKIRAFDFLMVSSPEFEEYLGRIERRVPLSEAESYRVCVNGYTLFG